MEANTFALCSFRLRGCHPGVGVSVLEGILCNSTVNVLDHVLCASVKIAVLELASQHRILDCVGKRSGKVAFFFSEGCVLQLRTAREATHSFVRKFNKFC